MFKFLKNKENNHEVVAIVSGKMCNISQVEDPMFSSKMMGDGLAIISDKDEVIVCSPCSGDLKVLFPTGHAFGVKMKNGVEILVHIGVDTGESNGDGFQVLNVKQGDYIRAGQPVIKVNLKQLREKYDMPIMMIFTNTNGFDISLPQDRVVEKKEVLINLNA